MWLGTLGLIYKANGTQILSSVLLKCDVLFFSQKKRTLKGSIELSRIKCVEIVKSDISIPCHYKYPFQVSLPGLGQIVSCSLTMVKILSHCERKWRKNKSSALELRPSHEKDAVTFIQQWLSTKS